MSTTLTREAIRERGKLRYEVREVPGWGSVGIRSCPEVRRVQRQLQFADEESQAKYRVFMLVDQLMQDEQTTLFEPADVEWLCNIDSYTLDALVATVSEFNGEDKSEKKEQGESID